jgi:hypothetical protein
VPSLRDIRDLETAERQVERRSEGKPGRPWDLRRGALFGGGLVVIFCGVVLLGLAGLQRLSLDTTPPPPENLGPDFESIDRMSAVQVMDTWNLIREQGLGPYRKSGHAAQVEAAQRLRKFFFAGLIIVVAGILISAGAWLVPLSPRQGP